MFGVVNGTFAAYEEGPNTAVSAPLVAHAAPGAARATTGPGGEAAQPERRIGDRDVIAEEEITVGKPYFGSDSTWIRYKLARSSAAPARDRYSLWLDVINVSDRQRLVDFGVEECYRFHGQSIDASQSVSLGHGVVAQIVETAFLKNGRHWLVLWWERPVQVGTAIHHERVVLLAPASADPTDRPVSTDGGPLVQLDFGPSIPADHRGLADDLVGLAVSIVADSGTPAATAQ
jgi:hypothetical protein